jgi:hypothetical protein
MFDNLKVLCTKEGEIDNSIHPIVFLKVLAGSKDVVFEGDILQEYVFYLPVNEWYQALNQKIKKMPTPFVSWYRSKKDIEEKYIRKYFKWSSREYRTNIKLLTREEINTILCKFELEDKERKELQLETEQKIKTEKPKKEGMLSRWVDGV